MEDIPGVCAPVKKTNRRQRRRVASALDVGAGVEKKKRNRKVGAAKCVGYVVGLSS